MRIDDVGQLEKIIGFKIISVGIETDIVGDTPTPSGIRIVVQNPTTEKISTLAIRAEIAGYNKTFNVAYPSIGVSAYRGDIPTEELQFYDD